MKGTVKFYNSEKGFGFIFSEGLKQDIYFHINDWKHPSVPVGNDDIEFELQDDKRGFRADNIRLISSAVEKCNAAYTTNAKDDRVLCPSCSKKIVPRMITFRGKPDKSVCPYCAATVKNFREGCFIATAVYGDIDHPSVVVLREFRDKKLLTNTIGIWFVEWYYRWSPKVANYVRGKRYFTKPVKFLLEILVKQYKRK
ncbi:MAG: cold shock domain-containing protein [Sulfuricurvum sp.]|nr:cold shock domain-containing protein [Sulfuricurvum sp.]